MRVKRKPAPIPESAIPKKTIVVSTLLEDLADLCHINKPLEDIIGDFPLNELHINTERWYDSCSVQLLHMVRKDNPNYDEELVKYEEKQAKYEKDMVAYLEYKKDQAEKELKHVKKRLENI